MFLGGITLASVATTSVDRSEEARHDRSLDLDMLFEGWLQATYI